MIIVEYFIIFWSTPHFTRATSTFNKKYYNLIGKNPKIIALSPPKDFWVAC